MVVGREAHVRSGRRGAKGRAWRRYRGGSTRGRRRGASRVARVGRGRSGRWTNRDTSWSCHPRSGPATIGDGPGHYSKVRGRRQYSDRLLEDHRDLSLGNAVIASPARCIAAQMEEETGFASVETLAVDTRICHEKSERIVP